MCAGHVQLDVARTECDACPKTEPGMAGWPGTGVSLHAIPTCSSQESLWSCGYTLKGVKENQKYNKTSFREALCCKLGLTS